MMREKSRLQSPEIVLVSSIAISVMMAAIASQVPVARFGNFWQMAAVLIAADLAVYLLMRLGIITSSR
jgi:hypothetical protein